MGKRFRDTLNDQQRIVFPLIEQVLKCPVKVAKVYVSDTVPEVMALA